MDKNTKILIPEIPGEWTQRQRNGSLNVWNGADHHRFHRTTTDLPEVSLRPPENGLYAERIDGAWYWVSGCASATEPVRSTATRCATSTMFAVFAALTALSSRKPHGVTLTASPANLARTQKTPLRKPRRWPR